MIAGQTISLHDIEHRILCPIWNNPRIHYALNCASIGCPDLLPDVFFSSSFVPTLNLFHLSLFQNLL
ncbi:DUF547 domain-containing protein [Endozoicomonas sp. YOMI1]|uniref:DUF547 domain-containing protein n=1 Tax=Endozoicomonas sp. YOMI1 TaxID=2828739 RepID=UPI0035A16132